jgi:hypothetical protein
VPNAKREEVFQAAGRLGKMLRDSQEDLARLEKVTRRVDRIGNISLAIALLGTIAAIIALYISLVR